jgi:hypothetical protein
VEPTALGGEGFLIVLDGGRKGVCERDGGAMADTGGLLDFTEAEAAFMFAVKLTLIPARRGNGLIARSMSLTPRPSSLISSQESSSLSLRR